MSTHGRCMLAAALTVAAVLIAPSIANAKIFTVSQDVTIYAEPNTSKPLRPYPAGGRVDVRCYTKGQSIDGYAVWDRIKNGNDGFAYVHDKYVEMQNGGDPAANGVISCDGNETKPPVGTCVKGGFSTRYLSEVRNNQPDHSYAKLTWEPRMCLQTDGWRLVQTPELKAMPAGGTLGIGVEFEGVRHNGPRASYHGQIVQCLPFSIGYKGIGFTGSGCFSKGTVDISATVNKDGKIGTPTYSLTNPASSLNAYEWTTKVL
jgi:hypothetical protein